jgi:hypothetical protein
VRSRSSPRRPRACRGPGRPRRALPCAGPKSHPFPGRASAHQARQDCGRMAISVSGPDGPRRAPGSRPQRHAVRAPGSGMSTSAALRRGSPDPPRALGEAPGLTATRLRHAITGKRKGHRCQEQPAQRRGPAPLRCQPGSAGAGRHPWRGGAPPTGAALPVTLPTVMSPLTGNWAQRGRRLNGPRVPGTA